MGTYVRKEDPTVDPLVERELVGKPFESQRSIAKRLGVSENRVAFVQKRMGQKGRTRRRIRQELLAAFLRDCPNGTVADCAKALGTDIWHVLQIKGSSALAGAKEERLRLVQEGRVEFCAAPDENVVTALRPESYVCEVCGAGYWGICLPDDEFKTYLEFRERRKKYGENRYINALGLADQRATARRGNAG